MRTDIGQEVAAMRRMTGRQLLAKYEDLFGEPPRCRHKEHLVRRIAWGIQALAEGGLSERARQRAAELADGADIRSSNRPARRAKRRAASAEAKVAATRDARLPRPGTLLVRHYRGATLQVKVLEQGFEYDGQVYKSLTALTKRITGRHWNGFHFFGIQKRGGTP